jgi:hypothetical protein
LTPWRLPVLVHDDPRVRQLEPHSSFEQDPKLRGGDLA